MKKKIGRPFRRGNPGGPGGKRSGAGRKPDEFRAIMRGIASSEDSVKFVDGCIKGEKVDGTYVKDEGFQKHEPDATTRLKALDYATTQGYGKVQILATMDGEGELAPLQVLMLGAQTKGTKGKVQE